MTGREETSVTESAGFTLVEVVVVSAVLLPILMMIGSTTGLIQSSMGVNEARGNLVQTMHRTAERVGHLLRPAAMSTIEHRVNLGGAWQAPTELQPGVGLRFKYAEGSLSINATALSSLRTLEFVLDQGETANGQDDDGDGLVDEGSLVQRQDGVSWPLANGVESCLFTLEGRVMRFSLTCGRSVDDGRVIRATAQLSCFIRNN